MAWATVVLFSLVGASTLEPFLGIVFVVLILPAVLFVQWLIRWVFGGFRSHLAWLRRCVMAIPAFAVALALFPSTNGFGGRQTASIKIALAGHTPAGLREMHVRDEGWTDTVIRAYFECDPEGLRQILEHEPFQRLDYSTGFSFSRLPFKDVQGKPDVTGVVEFQRTDLERVQGLCHVYTDAGFRFAYVVYGVD